MKTPSLLISFLSPAISGRFRGCDGSILKRAGALFLALFFVLFTAERSFSQAGDPLYGQQIHLPADASEKLVTSAEALKKWLGQMTGKDFTVTEETTGKGIFLALESSSHLPSWDLEALKAKPGVEAFQIKEDADQLWIIGRTDLAVDDGVYWYLDKLGARWLIPSEKWTVMPKRESIRFDETVVEAPAFAMRDFAGTGY